MGVSAEHACKTIPPQDSIVTPTFSVIIPTYNRLEYLRETVGTVLNQSYRDFEITVGLSSANTDRLTEEEMQAIVEYPPAEGI
jgi:GT2 family glycosyltransferase